MTKYIDLFCGMGSFHNSFRKLGFECVYACDIEGTARKVYESNYGLKPKDDIKKIDPTKEFDTEKPYHILCAGFPCQPFSQAGHHKGFADIRGTMFAETMRFVKHNEPQIVVLENVAGLLTHDKGLTFSTIKKTLENSNYTVVYKVLTCSDYGIPQMRKRIFIVCYKDIEPRNIEQFWDLTDYEKKTTLTKFLGKNFEKDTAYTLRCGGRRSPLKDRHNWDGYVVDGREYRLTIDDGLKLQGFHDFDISGVSETKQWKLLGNTIPTIFTHIIGSQLIKHFPSLELRG